jgi:hypothetical protein
LLRQPLLLLLRLSRGPLLPPWLLGMLLLPLRRRLSWWGQGSQMLPWLMLLLLLLLLL